MIDWIGSQRRFHAVLNGSSVCGSSIGGETFAELPCEQCLGLLFGMLDAVPGLEPVDA